MTEQFETELARSLATLRESIAPYTRFVRAEHDKVSRIDARLTELRDEAATLRHQVEHWTAPRQEMPLLPPAGP
jgi:hypothetical protein